MTLFRTHLSYPDLKGIHCCLTGRFDDYVDAKQSVTLYGDLHLIFFDLSEDLTAPRMSRIPQVEAIERLLDIISANKTVAKVPTVAAIEFYADGNIRLVTL